MSKVHSVYLLLMTLVFSTAQTPTLQFWRGLPAALGAHDDGQAASFDAGRAVSFGPDDMIAALPREYAEDGDLKRFQLDELYLPKLDVSLPELFDWTDIGRAYLADAAIPGDASDLALDSTDAAAFRIASLNGAFAFGTGGRLGGAGGSIGSSEPSGDAPGSDASSPGQSGKGSSSESNGTETLPGDSNGDDTELPGDSNGDDTEVPGNEIPTYPIEDPKPVPVPAPGALGLFALGLAGLRLAGRNKNRSG